MKILLSRLDRLGDLILSTPAIRSLRRSFPAAHITLACSAHNVAAVERNPDVDQIVIADGRRTPREIGRSFRGDVDLAIALAPRTEDMQLVGASRAKARVGYTYTRRYGARLCARLLLTHRMVSAADPELCERDATRPVMHEVMQLLELARLGGATEIVPELVLPIGDEERAAAADLPRGIYVHLAPRWLVGGSSEANFTALLTELRELGRPIVVTYATECRDVAERLREKNAADAVVGKLGFGAWAAVFERADCVVTVDTGATHVASALGRPTVVLFEHKYFSLNSREWAPYGVPNRVVRKPEGDSPEAFAHTRRELRSAVESLLGS